MTPTNALSLPVASPVAAVERRVGRRAYRKRAERCAAVLVEFALILPVLITLVLAGLDFGRFAYAHMAVTNSARVGAGYGSMHPYTTGTQLLWQSNVRDAVKGEMEGIPNYDDSLLAMTTPQVTTDSDGQKCVRVEVAYPFTTLVDWPFLPHNFSMNRAVEMRFTR